MGGTPKDTKPVSREKAGSIKMFLGFSVILFVVSLVVLVLLSTGHIDKMQAIAQHHTQKLQTQAARTVSAAAQVTQAAIAEQAQRAEAIARIQSEGVPAAPAAVPGLTRQVAGATGRGLAAVGRGGLGLAGRGLGAAGRGGLGLAGRGLGAARRGLFG